MRIVSVGHAVFAAILIALGGWCVLRGDVSPVWAPVPRDVPARQVLVYLCALVSIASGVGLVWRRTAAIAARGLLAYLVLWSLVFRVREVVRAPAVFGSWDGCAETAVIVAAVWVLHVWLADDWDRRRLGLTVGDRGLRIARVLYGISLIPFGVAHFIYPRETAALVPSWLPAHLAWAYVTGGAFLAAGAAVLVGVWARLAAALAAVQIGLFTLLVWVPLVAAGKASAFAWSELGLSVALTAAAWVVAESYRGTR
jgi:uncharacterized membrane protein